MQSSPAGKMDTNGANFDRPIPRAGLCPNPCVRLDPKPLNAVFCDSAENDLLDVSDVSVNIGEKAFQVENGVADDLPGAVECDVAAAVDGEKFNAARLQR